MAEEAQAIVENAGKSNATGAFCCKDFYQRVRAMNCFEMSYNGGPEYKSGVDMNGAAILIEHETESPFSMVTAGSTSIFSSMASSQPGSTREQLKSGRYARRWRIAAYENHCKPIVDKFASYLTSNEPHRHERVTEEANRVKLDEYISRAVGDGLKLTEAWVGVHAASFPTGQVLTQAQAAALDPKNKGRPYLVSVDARRVVDREIDCETKRVIRVTFEETEVTKGGFTKPETSKTFFKEWTANEWVRYELVEDGAVETPSEGDRKVREVSRGTHSFGRCPWVCFRPEFPIKDLAELNRQLFNVSSLADEELFQNTFTQKWATGIKGEQIAKMSTGTGNFLWNDEVDSEFGAFGAVDGQSQALRERIAELRDAMYHIAAMEGQTVKNSAEAAEKKKRDLESLYKMLAKVTLEMERLENELLFLLGAAAEDDSETHTSYEYTFDVSTLQESLECAQVACSLPFMPPDFKREMVLALIQKMDPFGEHDRYKEAASGLIDVSTALVESLATLKRDGMLTPEAFAALVGAPPEAAKTIAELWAQHHEQTMEEKTGGLNGDLEDNDGAEGNDQGGAGSGGGSGGGPPA